jgi:hypothetical protein
MPISSIDDLGAAASKELNVLVDDGNDFVAVRDWKGAAWAEIILNVNNDERGVLVNLNWHWCSMFGSAWWKLRVP